VNGALRGAVAAPRTAECRFEPTAAFFGVAVGLCDAPFTPLFGGAVVVVPVVVVATGVVVVDVEVVASPTPPIVV
jgi:hypothetical protein